MCKLNKAIYALKQAPKSWFHKLSETLCSLGFNSTKSDTSLFTHFKNDTILFILIYVDDILITWNSPNAIQSLITTLSHHFGLKNLGRLQYFLGVEVHWTLMAVYISLKQNTFLIFYRKLTWVLRNRNQHQCYPFLVSQRMPPLLLKILHCIVLWLGPSNTSLSLVQN